jgi:hypothetical protein
VLPVHHAFIPVARSSTVIAGPWVVWPGIFTVVGYFVALFVCGFEVFVFTHHEALMLSIFAPFALASHA